MFLFFGGAHALDQMTKTSCQSSDLNIDDRSEGTGCTNNKNNIIPIFSSSLLFLQNFLSWHIIKKVCVFGFQNIPTLNKDFFDTHKSVLLIISHKTYLIKGGSYCLPHTSKFFQANEKLGTYILSFVKTKGLILIPAIFLNSF